MKHNKATVTIELDRVRELWFGHRAMKRWSAYTGKSLDELETSMKSPEGIEILLYFMLEKDAASQGEALKMESMEDLMDLVPIGIIYEKISQAIQAAFPDSNGINEKNVIRAAGTGKKA